MITTDKSNQELEQDQDQVKKQRDSSVLPQPGTLHTTDPQENMKGPISSLVHKVEKKVEDIGGDKKEEEADKEK